MYKDSFVNIYTDTHKCLTKKEIALEILHHKSVGVARITISNPHLSFLVNCLQVAFLGNRTEAIKEGQRLFDFEIKKENKNEGG